jgi:hypothetical protein
MLEPRRRGMNIFKLLFLKGESIKKMCFFLQPTTHGEREKLEVMYNAYVSFPKLLSKNPQRTFQYHKSSY